MAIKLVINLDQSSADLLEGYGAGALIRVERDSDPAFGSATEIATEAIVSGTEQYEVWDPAGTSSSWYRTRISDSAASSFSAYSDGFQGGALATYATILDVTKGMPLEDDEHHAYVADLLADSTEAIDDLCGRSFFRDPQVSGTDTWTLDVSRPGERSLALSNEGEGFSDGGALDLVSITTLEYRDSEGDDYVTLVEGTDFVLRRREAPGWPYEDVLLMSTGSLSAWPTGIAAARITGVRGFPAVPGRIRRAQGDAVRDEYRQGPMGVAPPTGVNQFGVPIIRTGRPVNWREVMTPHVSPYVKRSYAGM